MARGENGRITNGAIAPTHHPYKRPGIPKATLYNPEEAKRQPVKIFTPAEIAALNGELAATETSAVNGDFTAGASTQAGSNGEDQTTVEEVSGLNALPMRCARL